MDRVTFHSDAPLQSERVTTEAGAALLVRRPDPAFARDVRARRLFLEEREAAARIPARSPYLLAPTGADGGAESLSRPFLPQTLEERLRESPPLTGSQILWCVHSQLAALEALEEAGLVHGDPGPRNLLVDAASCLRLADPVSARRRWALAGLEDPATTGTDRSAPIALARRWLSHAPKGDELAPRIREILGRPWEAERKLAALERIPRGPEVALSRGTAREAASPVRVRLRLGPLTDGTVREDSCRLLEGEGVPLPDGFGTRLALETLTLTTTFPDPAREIVNRLAAAGASADILADLVETA